MKELQKPIYPMRCLTTWGAVLDVSKFSEARCTWGRGTAKLFHVHDPDAFDPGGEVLHQNEIVLLWRIKKYFKKNTLICIKN